MLKVTIKIEMAKIDGWRVPLFRGVLEDVGAFVDQTLLYDTVKGAEKDGELLLRAYLP